jgi:anaerobic ribonucleoside-triphosphate reductase
MRGTQTKKKEVSRLNYKEDRDGNLVLEDGTIIPAGKRQRAEVYSRVVGYLRPVEQWNDGKQAEFADRKTYSSKSAVPTTSGL